MNASHAPRSVSPLAVFWPYGRRFRGRRIDSLPTNFIAWCLANRPHLPPPVKGALIAETGFRILVNDQWEGR